MLQQGLDQVFRRERFGDALGHARVQRIVDIGFSGTGGHRDHRKMLQLRIFADDGDGRIAGLIRKNIASLTQGASISKNYESYDRYFPFALILALLFLSGSMILQRDKTST